MHAQIVDGALDLVARDAVREDHQRLGIFGNRLAGRTEQRLIVVARLLWQHTHVVGHDGFRVRLLQDVDRADGGPLAHLGLRQVAAQERVDHFGDVLVDREPVAILNLDDDVEGRRLFALEHGFARAAPARFFIGEGDGTDPAQQVGQRRVHQQVVQRLAVRRADQLHAALGDRARREGFGFGADLVDDDHLRHVVLDCLDHHVMLQMGIGDRHPARVADSGMRNVAVTGDFVGRVDDHDALALFGEHTRAFAQHRRLADARTSEQADRFPAADHVEDDVDRAVDRTADAARQPNDAAGAIANRADAMQRLLDARAVVAAERRESRGDVRDVFSRDRRVSEKDEVVIEPRLGRTPQVEDDFDDAVEIRETDERLAEREGEDV